MAFELKITVKTVISDEDAEVFLKDTSDVWADDFDATLMAQAEFVKDALREPTNLGTDWKVTEIDDGGIALGAIVLLLLYPKS